MYLVKGCLAAQSCTCWRTMYLRVHWGLFSSKILAYNPYIWSQIWSNLYLSFMHCFYANCFYFTVAKSSWHTHSKMVFIQWSNYFCIILVKPPVIAGSNISMLVELRCVLLDTDSCSHALEMREMNLASFIYFLFFYYTREIDWVLLGSDLFLLHLDGKYKWTSVCLKSMVIMQWIWL